MSDDSYIKIEQNNTNINSDDNININNAYSNNISSSNDSNNKINRKKKSPPPKKPNTSPIGIKWYPCLAMSL